MPGPTIVMDFTTHTVGIVGVDPGAAQKLQAALDAQKDVVVSAGAAPPQPDDVGGRVRIAWAIPCRYAEVNEGFATIVGGGANVYVVPAAALPTELAVTIATQIAGGEEELGHPHHLRGLVLGPDMEPTGEPLDVPDLEIPAGEHKPSGWEGTIVIPIVMHWTVEEPGTYTIQLSIDDRNTTVAIHVETPEEEPG